MPPWAGGRRKRQPYVRKPWSFGLVVPSVAVAAVLTWAILPPGLPAGPITGKVRVIDGDTLDIGTRRVRLVGIDAPERSQQCTDAAGNPSFCGEISRETLEGLVGRGPATCTPIELDRYGRVIATCDFRDADLGELMVASGQALANGRYGDLEAEARLAGRGLWAGRFDTPVEWRRAHQIDDAEGAPDWPVASFVNWVAKVFFR